MKEIVIESDRLYLRRWQRADLEPFSALNADPKVMEYFPSTLSRAETETTIAAIEKKIEKNGFGFWAAELKETQEWIGFIGLSIPGYVLPFSPCVEIGWRLAHRFWGRGLAQEGARACLRYGFDQLKLKEIVSFTAVGNLRSRNVMEKIGMRHDEKGDFDHPNLSQDHPLRRHVLYRISSL